MCSKLTPQMAQLATRLLAGEFLGAEIYRLATLLLEKHARIRVIACHILGLAQLLLPVKILKIYKSKKGLMGIKLGSYHPKTKR